MDTPSGVPLPEDTSVGGISLAASKETVFTNGLFTLRGVLRVNGTLFAPVQPSFTGWVEKTNKLHIDPKFTVTPWSQAQKDFWPHRLRGRWQYHCTNFSFSAKKLGGNNYDVNLFSNRHTFWFSFHLRSRIRLWSSKNFLKSFITNFDLLISAPIMILGLRCNLLSMAGN